MTLISLVLVFVLEQVRPLPLPNAVQSMLAGYFDNLSGQFNAGERRQGAMAWLLAVAPLVIVSLLLYYLLGTASVLLALAFKGGGILNLQRDLSQLLFEGCPASVRPCVSDPAALQTANSKAKLARRLVIVRPGTTPSGVGFSLLFFLRELVL